MLIVVGNVTGIDSGVAPLLPVVNEGHFAVFVTRVPGTIQSNFPVYRCKVSMCIYSVALVYRARPFQALVPRTGAWKGLAR